MREGLASKVFDCIWGSILGLIVGVAVTGGHWWANLAERLWR